jgi:hypothetical protein
MKENHFLFLQNGMPAAIHANLISIIDSSCPKPTSLFLESLVLMQKINCLACQYEHKKCKKIGFGDICRAANA